jgi:hypothetical protein
MSFQEMKIQGAFVHTPIRHEDNRGHFEEQFKHSLLEKELGLPWVLDDPSEVTLVLEQGAWLSIEVPHFGEDLPLALDCHHDDEGVLVQVVESLAAELREKLGWETRAF